MKYVFCLFFGLGIFSSSAQVVYSESFEMGCANLFDPFGTGCYPDWIATSGTPDIFLALVPPPDGFRRLNFKAYYLGACDYPNDKILAESAALNFDFQAGTTYNIRYWMRGQAENWGWFLVPDALYEARTGVGCHSGFFLPSIPNGSVALEGGAPQGPFILNDWIQVEQTITPTADFEQLWFRPMNNIPPPPNAPSNGLTTVEIDLVEIEIIDTCHLSAPTLLGCNYNEDAALTTLNWESVAGAVEYEVFVNIGDPLCGCPFDNFSFTNTTPTNSLEITGNFTTKCFSYTVRAICGNGQQSPPVTGCYDGGEQCVEPPCDLEVGFELPAAVCLGDPITFVNQSTNYNSHLLMVCRAGADGTCNGFWLDSGWQNNELGTIDLAQAYNNWSGSLDWIMECGYTYRVALAVRNDCSSWLSETQFITVNCPPCPDLDLQMLPPFETGNEQHSERSFANSDQPSLFSSPNPPVEVLPNPFTSTTRLQFDLAQAANLQLALYGMDGRLLHREVAHFEAGLQHWNIKEDWLPGPGIYTYRLKVNQEETIGKLLKIN